MPESFRRPCMPVGGAPAVRRTALSLTGAVLALALLAVPVQAEPDAPPGAGRSGDAPAQSGSLPAPDHAAAHDAIDRESPSTGQPGPQGPPDGVPAGPPAEVPAGPPAEVPAGPGQAGEEAAPAEPVAEAAPGQKVVVCKYVRKPGVAEVFSHIIVVNENALLGKGFAGVFPFAFSDAHFNSVAVRYAARGEQAKDVDETTCPAGTPPGEEPPGEEPGGEEPPGDVGGVVEDADPMAAGDRAPGLPSTGAADGVVLLGLLGATALLGGCWLALRSRPRRAG